MDKRDTDNIIRENLIKENEVLQTELALIKSEHQILKFKDNANESVIKTLQGTINALIKKQTITISELIKTKVCAELAIANAASA